jgi:hypothetical protein
LNRELLDLSDDFRDESTVATWAAAVAVAVLRTRTDSTSTPSFVSERTSSSLCELSAFAACWSATSIVAFTVDPRSAT